MCSITIRRTAVIIQKQLQNRTTNHWSAEIDYFYKLAFYFEKVSQFLQTAGRLW